MSGLSTKSKSSKGEKVLVGSGNGVLTLWERGQWDDQDERIVVDTGKESLDVLATVTPGVGKAARGELVAVGMGDGRVKIVEIGRNKVVGECRHDEAEGVVGLGFEVEGRMVSGGGAVVKVWQEAVDKEDYEEEGKKASALGLKRGIGSENTDSDGEDEDSSEEEEKVRKRRKKRKQVRGKDRTGEQHVVAFNGLD